MDFKLYRNNANIDFENFKEKLKKIDFYTAKKEDIGVFHYNEVLPNVYHIIFYINEEYRTGSKFVERISSIPMDIYINSFIILEKNMIFIENIYDEYCQLIINNINSKFNLLFDKIILNNNYFCKLVYTKVRKVLQCDFEIDGSLIQKENKNDTIKLIDQGEQIYFINFTLDLHEYTDILISIKKDGKYNIATNVPIVLVSILRNLIEDIAIE
ncbi:hypothetical protein G6Z02_09515 [Clostridium perfringens]|uniref:Uncharacterized protein n=1 Tax=Clostridium perfringens TaxID=1502 RepID=A0A6G4ZFZ5_CLOPF|nr:hypothetical protein [Clostridium perfringens]NGT90439.1 hypothetical protein [Clostridium perfringens]